MTRTWTLRLLALLVSLGMVVAACSSDSDDSSTASADDGFAFEEPAAAPVEGARQSARIDDGDAAMDEAEPEPEPAEEPASGGGGAQGDGADRVPTPVLDIGRSIVFVANVEVVVDDVPLAASRAKTAIAGLGGLVFGEDTTVSGQARTTLEFKVLPQDFETALDRLEGLGELRSQQISADDVTERVVDLESRITTASASVERLRNFLDTATDSRRVAELEAQLLERETTLELLRGQLRTLQGQVDLATIFLTLTETAPPAIEPLGEYRVTYYEGDDGGQACPGADELRIDEGETFTVCVEITNVGTNPIVDVEVRDTGLDLARRDFAFLDDADDEPLIPGATMFAWAATEAPGDGFSNVVVTGEVADEDGESLRISVDFFSPEGARITFVEDDSLPGFTDALSGSWDALVTFASVVVLVFAGAIPFLWVPVVVWLVWRWLRRSRSRHTGGTDESMPPAPPTPPPAPVGATVDGD